MQSNRTMIIHVSSNGGKSFVTLKNENEVRQYYFLTTCTTAKNHRLPFHPRFINAIYAFFCGYFWLPCDICGKKYGGHETYGSKECTTICPRCVLKHYNETGKLNY